MELQLSGICDVMMHSSSLGSPGWRPQGSGPSLPVTCIWNRSPSILQRPDGLGGVRCRGRGAVPAGKHTSERQPSGISQASAPAGLQPQGRELVAQAPHLRRVAPAGGAG